jgi:hypothetical protein
MQLHRGDLDDGGLHASQLTVTPARLRNDNHLDLPTLHSDLRPRRAPAFEHNNFGAPNRIPSPDFSENAL